MQQLHLAQQVVEGVALPAPLRVAALKHRCTAAPRDACRRVGAVIRHDEYLYQLLRVVLRLYAVDEVADDLLLVARGDEHGEAVRPGGRRGLLRGEP